MLSSERFAQAAQGLAGQGISYQKMDCQAFMEVCLAMIGIRADWKGSNAMYRDMAWVGTPEECRARYGKIPVGAWLYIWADDGGEVARGYRDGLGNASHVGVYTGQGLGAVHSSSSRGCVCESKFAGRTIPNGGWNRVGLCKLLDYGLGDQPEDSAEEASPVEEPMGVRVCPACGQEMHTAYTRLLKKGAEGEDVAAIQRMLMYLGYDVGASGADGIFGSRTQNAVRRFQTVRGLTVDGVVGPETRAALMG